MIRVISSTCHVGSSPHVWGTHFDRHGLGQRGRFIPTCVGNTDCSRHFFRAHAVHPPRVWGTHSGKTEPRRKHRFIPTCLGNMQLQWLSNQKLPVHPHVRGEHQDRQIREFAKFGSSPRAWGTPSQSRIPFFSRWFIPTCVGNTIIRGSFRLSKTVHPHVRGEHGTFFDGIPKDCGSSPRAWGTHKWVGRCVSGQRFIPTCVGNTSSSRPPALSTSVHPHVRGEHISSLSRTRSSIGSSPRAWGTRIGLQKRIDTNRFIPTCVGNTDNLTVTSPLFPVHPHVRGEHTI